MFSHTLLSKLLYSATRYPRALLSGMGRVHRSSPCTKPLAHAAYAAPIHLLKIPKQAGGVAIPILGARRGCERHAAPVSTTMPLGPFLAEAAAPAPLRWRVMIIFFLFH